MTVKPKQEIRVNTFTGGTVGPSIPMIGPLANGGVVIADTAPGCWGPMITPSFQGGHEVTTPIAVEGAEPGDAIAIRIRKIRVTSAATASGTMTFVDGRYTGDPFVARHCPGCGTENPNSRVEGIGPEAIRCAECGAEVSPFRLSNGYTIVFDEQRQMALTVGAEVAERMAGEARRVMALPESCSQNPVLALCPSDLPGIITRMRPFLGNIGSTPAIDMPDSHNAGDFGQFLVNAPHKFGITAEQLELRTDGHMDIDSVREGAILICPVKVQGGGIYLGDAHAMQGDGELAGHTTDVSAEVTLKLSVMKGHTIDGPILLPPIDDLPHLARPLSASEQQVARVLADRFGQSVIEDAAPLQFVGSGANLNDATENGIARAAKLLGMSKEEIERLTAEEVVY